MLSLRSPRYKVSILYYTTRIRFFQNKSQTSYNRFFVYLNILCFKIIFIIISPMLLQFNTKKGQFSPKNITVPLSAQKRCVFTPFSALTVLQLWCVSVLSAPLSGCRCSFLQRFSHKCLQAGLSFSALPVHLRFCSEPSLYTTGAVSTVPLMLPHHSRSEYRVSVQSLSPQLI